MPQPSLPGAVPGPAESENTLEAALWPALADALSAVMPAGGAIRVAPGMTASGVDKADQAATAFGVPLLAMPLDPRGGFAAQRAEYAPDAALAFLRARAQSCTGGNVWVQAELAGEVHWAVCARKDRVWHVRQWLGVASTLGHAAVPMELVAPSAPHAQQYLEPMLAAALDAVAPRNQEVIVQVVTTPEAMVFAFAWGSDAPDPQIARLTEAAARHGAACLRYLEPEAGHVVRIAGAEIARVRPSVIEVCVVAQQGDAIRHITSVAARDAVGWVLGIGSSAARARDAANNAAADIHIETTAYLPGCS